MIVSPLDYELYPRVTGQPIPMSAAERMKMAPVVNEFTKNYTKAQNRQSMGRNILKIGALGALGAGMYYGLKGSRDFGTPSQELGQEITENSTGSGLIQKAVDNAAAAASTDTIPDSLTRSEDQFPQQTEENAVASTTEPSQLNINESVEASVKKPTPNIDAAIERKNVRKPTPSVARGRYQQYETTTNPEERQERNLAAMVGGGEIFVKKGKEKGKVFKTEEAQLYDDKGEKELLGKYVGMMKNVDPSLKEVLGQTTDTTGPELLVDDTFGSPLTGHPDLPPGEDDITLPGGMNTSSTTNLPYVDPKKVLAMATIGSGNVSNVFSQELAKRGVDLRSPEEILIASAEIEKRRTPNPLEQRAIDNESAMDSMRLSDEEREKESIRLGSTGGIPNKTDMEKIRKSPEFKAAQESMKPKSVTEKANDLIARTDFTIGGMKDRKTGLGKSVGISLTPMNGDTAVTYNIMNDPTKPLDVTRTHFTATPEAVKQIETGTGELGEASIGQQYNKGKRRMAGLGKMDPSRIDDDNFLIT